MLVHQRVYHPQKNHHIPITVSRCWSNPPALMVKSPPWPPRGWLPRREGQLRRPATSGPEHSKSEFTLPQVPSGDEKTWRWPAVHREIEVSNQRIWGHKPTCWWRLCFGKEKGQLNRYHTCAVYFVAMVSRPLHPSCKTNPSGEKPYETTEVNSRLVNPDYDLYDLGRLP